MSVKYTAAWPLIVVEPTFLTTIENDPPPHPVVDELTHALSIETTEVLFPVFVVLFPMNPITYAYTITPAAIAIKIRSKVAMIGLIPFFSLIRFFLIIFQLT